MTDDRTPAERVEDARRAQEDREWKEEADRRRKAREEADRAEQAAKAARAEVRRKNRAADRERLERAEVLIDHYKHAPLSDYEFRRRVVTRLSWLVGGVWFIIISGIIAGIWLAAEGLVPFVTVSI